MDPQNAPVDPVDPAWWRDVLAAHPESGIALASLRLGEASLVAASLDAQAVLSLLALVTSAMLDPDDWNDPFKPMAVFQGRRSAVPSDLDAEQLDLLRRIAEAMDSSDAPALRARVSEICWTYGNRGDAAMLTQAIESYSSVPLEPDQWYRDGRSEWKRGLELVKRRGRSALNQLDAMADTLRRRLDAGTSADGFFGVQLSATIREYGLAVRSDAETLAKLCVGRAGDADEAGNLMLRRGWEEEATAWYAMADRKSDAYAAQVRIAHSFAAEAQSRRDGGGGQAMAAAHFVELALSVLTTLPRTYRAEHGLDDLISQLRRLLQEDRQRILDGMVSIKSDPIDISNLVETARRKVSDLEQIEVLVALGSVHTWMPFDAAIQQAESSMASHPLLSLFGNETFNGTGQKVASRPGTSPASVGRNDSETAIDPAVWATAVRDRTALFGLVVSARILPALEVVTTQHRYPIELLYDVCRNSPLDTSRPRADLGTWPPPWAQ